MGLYSLPSPSEGMLIMLVANTAMSIAILKQILSSALALLGIRCSFAPDAGSEQPDPISSDPPLAERFRARFKPVRFGRRRPERFHQAATAADCRVCLAQFEPESVVNRLPCGHLFHRACVERWLDYQHATCPLCRSHLLPPADDGAAAEPCPNSIF